MNNVTPLTFKSTSTVKKVTYRTANWAYDTGGNHSNPDFKVFAHHSEGKTRFSSVLFEVFVAGRQSNESFRLTRADAIALRDMFDSISEDMK